MFLLRQAPNRDGTFEAAVGFHGAVKEKSKNGEADYQANSDKSDAIVFSRAHNSVVNVLKVDSSMIFTSVMRTAVGHFAARDPAEGQNKCISGI
jgi:hypothetical protein